MGLILVVTAILDNVDEFISEGVKAYTINIRNRIKFTEEEDHHKK